MATLMAGNDIPDIIHLYQGITGRVRAARHRRVREGQVPGPDPVPGRRRHQGLSQSGGHSDVRVDQLLVRHRRRALQLADPPLSGGLDYFFKNTDMWNQKVGADTVPKDAADLKKIITELNDPNSGVWGMGAQRGHGVETWASRRTR